LRSSIDRSRLKFILFLFVGIVVVVAAFGLIDTRYALAVRLWAESPLVLAGLLVSGVMWTFFGRRLLRV
jgi:hypothetical protein